MFISGLAISFDATSSVIVSGRVKATVHNNSYAVTLVNGDLPDCLYRKIGCNVKSHTRQRNLLLVVKNDVRNLNQIHREAVTQLTWSASGDAAVQTMLNKQYHIECAKK